MLSCWILEKWLIIKWARGWGRLAQWNNTPFVIFSLQRTTIWTPPGFFQEEFSSNNAQLRDLKICRQGSRKLESKKWRKNCSDNRTEWKGYIAKTYWPISTLLHNTSNQPCNLGQHSVTKAPHRRESPAMQHWSRGQVRRDLIQVRPPRGLRVWEEKRDGRKKYIPEKKKKFAHKYFSYKSHLKIS